ncbi:MAG: 50S ribosomal protein L30 [Candidatus Diapherotrites archaeon]|nr:50S ribosomal protein L30 [Candidatus Diapherotrites archaeon]
MFAVIRMRGEVKVAPDIKTTLSMLRLHKVNHAVLVSNNKATKGMLEKIKDYVTYGEIDDKVLAKLIIKRGRLPGNKRITEEYLKSKGINNIEELISALKGGKKIQDFGIKPVFRLSPPSKGLRKKGIKRSFREGGNLGYCGQYINKLLLKMI